MTRRARRARRRRTRVAIALFVAALIAVVAVVAWSIFGRDSSDDTPRAAVRAPSSTDAPRATTTTVPTNTPSTTAPTSSGPPYAVGVHRATLVDPSRPTAARGPTPASPSRTLPVTVRYPAAGAPAAELEDAPAVGGRFPLVVFAHGFDAAAADYAPLVRDLAAQGFVVAAPDFPLSSSAFPGPPTQADIENQARDVSFVADAIRGGNGGAFAGHVADGEVGVVGHSDGGDTVARVASNSCCFDPRVGAAVVLSGDEGSTGGQWGVADSAPMLFVQGTADVVNPTERTQQLYDDAAPPKQLVAIDGGAHLEPYTSGPQRGAVVALVAAFLHGGLDDPSASALVADRANEGGLRLLASA